MSADLIEWTPVELAILEKRELGELRRFVVAYQLEAGDSRQKLYFRAVY